MSAAVEAYRAFLGPTTVAFAIDGLDRLGVPVWSASAWQDAEGTEGHGVGYGAGEHDARRGALGEAAENLAALRYAKRVAPVELDLATALARGAVHPGSLSLVAGTAVPGALLWVPARDLAGRERLVPLEAAVTCAKEWAIAAGDRASLFPPITNGQGAGAGGDRDRAIRHGLLELVQRDRNWSQFKALDTGRLVQRREIEGVEVLVKYSGHALGVHAFHAAAVDPAAPPLARVCTGEGADPDPAVAAAKAATELCSSRARKQFFFGGEDALAVAHPAYRERFAAAARGPGLVELGWDLDARFDALLGDPAAFERVVQRITAVHERVPMPPASPGARLDGLDVLVVDMTEPGDAACVVKVVVPGLEAEVLSHHRLGPRGLADLRLRCPQLVSDAPVDGWREAAGAWVDTAGLEALAEAFIPLYREPDRHAYAACCASPTTPTA